MSDKNVSALGEILAAIHRDGGHYVYNHGIEKAMNESKGVING